MGDELTEAGGKTRLYVTADLGEGVALTLDEGQTHYLLHVLRAQAGNFVSLFNGRDGEWLGEVTTVAKRGAGVVCRKQTRPQGNQARCTPLNSLSASSMARMFSRGMPGLTPPPTERMIP